MGTTGEGPSLGLESRLELLRTAQSWRRAHPAFHLLAGTGMPSLEDTIRLTRAAFEQGMDGVVVLPPYYFRKFSDEGLFSWYSQVLQNAVPEGAAFFGYHIPGVTGIPLSLDLLARLLDAFPTRFAGIKDSSTSPQQARELGERFGDDMFVFNGTDPLFTLALENKASGCITALANLRALDLVRVWQAYTNGVQDLEAQARLLAVRSITDRYSPAAPLLKCLVAHAYHFPRWAVQPPLLELSAENEQAVLAELDALPFDWRK